MVDNFYREHCDDPSDTEEYKLIYRTITVVNKNKLDYVNDSEDHKSGKTYEQIQEELRAVTDENPSDFSVLSSELAV
ncbi:MAG: hypothetical protein K2M43_00735 [Mycoplasmoidaceae bacterium]|nr:hypothetical protein [Mycoplasmoidaceae bacterium]